MRSSLFAGVAALLLAGCGRQAITAYQVPKEKDSPPPGHAGHDHAGHGHGGMEASTVAAPKVNYTVPAGWQESASKSAMRVASFTVPGKDGQVADVAVIPLPGVGGQDLEIVNIWRDQAKLPRIDESELAKLVQSVDIGSHKGQLYEIASTELVIDGKFKTRILAASLSLPGMNWYFKMVGEEQLVASQKPSFVEFLKSISFATPAAPAAMASAGGAGMPSVGGSGAASALPNWKLPPDWKSQPPGQMLLAAFGIEDAALGKASVTVSSFPGDVGGVLANVNRWRTQVGLGPIEAAALDKETRTIEFNGLKAIVAEALGRDVKAGTDKPARLIAALIPHGDETWFFKLLGDDALATKQRDTFIAFVKSISFEKPAATAMPAAAQAPASVPATGSGNAAASGLPEWTIPANWKAQPPGQMLLATFGIEGGAAGQATLTVSSFPGDVGGVLANVVRWRGQIGLGSIDAAALDKETTPLDLAAGKAILVDMTGPKKTARNNSTRLIGAMLPHDGQTWYFKLTGDEAVAGKEKDAFLAFLKSLKFNHAH